MPHPLYPPCPLHFFPHDQLINFGLGRHICTTAKMRIGRHFLYVAQGRLPTGTPVDITQGAMKPALVGWVGVYMGSDTLEGQVTKSWYIFRWDRPEAEDAEEGDGGVSNNIDPITVNAQDMVRADSLSQGLPLRLTPRRTTPRMMRPLRC